MKNSLKLERLIVFSDLTAAQTNGVVQSYANLEACLAANIEVEHYNLDDIAPKAWVPFWNKEKIALPVWDGVTGKIDKAVIEILDKADLTRTAIHVATPEAGLCHRVTHICRKRGLHFTTAYHTQIPEYIKKRFKMGKDWAYRWSQLNHNKSAVILNRTEGMIDLLEEKGFSSPKALWRGGVDSTLFTLPAADFNRIEFLESEGILNFDPQKEVLLLFVGRVSPEKNPYDLIALHNQKFVGDKRARIVLVGEGESSPVIKMRRLKNVHLVGKKSRAMVMKYMWAADVFVFPSDTDTLGLVLIEALKTGTPVVTCAHQCFGADSINKVTMDHTNEPWVITAVDGYPLAINEALDPAHSKIIESHNQFFSEYYSIKASSAEFWSHQVPALTN